MCHTHAKHWMECAGRHCSNWVVKKCSIIPRFLISPPDPLLVHRRRGGMGEKRRLRTGDRKLYDWSIDKWWPIIFPVSSSLGANSKMILCMSGRSSLLTSPLYSHHHHHPAQHGLLYWCSPGTHCLPCSFTLLFGAGWDLIIGLNYCYYYSCFQLLFPCPNPADHQHHHPPPRTTYDDEGDGLFK